jgi:hypothetical protein
LNYKIVYAVESYNFHISLPPSKLKQKNYKFLKTDWTPTAAGNGGSGRYSTPMRGTVATAVGHGGRTYAAVPWAVDI